MSKFEDILEIKLPPDIKILGVTNSSKKVKDNFIFFALNGRKNHASIYIDEAIENGASIVIHNDKTYDSNSEKVIYVDDLEAKSSTKIIKFLEAYYELFDTSNNTYYAFTGTNGKTTSAYLCHQLLASQGKDSLYIGTIGTQYNYSEIDQSVSKKTTPDIFELFEIFKFYELENPISICIEISSHAIDQNRLQNINYFTAASILNIGSDHLDYHKSIEEYARTKFRLFDIESNLKLIDLDTYKKFNFEETDSLTTISNNNSAANIFYTIDSCDIKKSTFSIFDKEKNTYHFETSLFPKFNISNLIFAICSTGLSSFKIDSVNNLDFLTLPKGRSDLIDNIEANIIIDYAHNADGFEFFLSSIKDYFRNLVVVFGCGGDRDRSKRSKMLMSAFKFSNDVIFTSDNSRNERFEDILSDALDGSVNRDDITIIENRKEAIIYGSSIIKENDCLVILGKGHEETQEIKGNVMHFSDYEVVDEIYNWFEWFIVIFRSTR